MTKAYTDADRMAMPDTFKLRELLNTIVLIAPQDGLWGQSTGPEKSIMEALKRIPGKPRGPIYAFLTSHDWSGDGIYFEASRFIRLGRVK